MTTRPSRPCPWGFLCASQSMNKPGARTHSCPRGEIYIHTHTHPRRRKKKRTAEGWGGKGAHLQLSLCVRTSRISLHTGNGQISTEPSALSSLSHMHTHTHTQTGTSKTCRQTSPHPVAGQCVLPLRFSPPFLKSNPASLHPLIQSCS